MPVGRGHQPSTTRVGRGGLAVLLALIVTSLGVCGGRVAQARAMESQSGAASQGSPPNQSASARQGSQSSAAQESGNPINDQGSNFHYRSYVTGIEPKVAGLELQVLEFADRLLLRNHTGRTVTIFGYSHEPYARVLGNGTVEVNTHSPAFYLNQSFYGAVTVPASASSTAPPQWSVVDRTGQFEWHDHRIHYMSPAVPAQVTDKSELTKIFNWQVPIEVGTQTGVVNGQLFWTPEQGSKTPVAAIVALVAIVLLALLLVVGVRRRRSEPPGAGTGDGSAPSAESGAEAEASLREAW
jgi:hypothetical protein